MGPGPVVSHLVQIVHILLVLPHRLHFLQNLLCPELSKISEREKQECVTFYVILFKYLQRWFSDKKVPVRFRLGTDGEIM